MSVRRRILAIQLSDKLKKNPEYAKKLGVNVEFVPTKDKQKNEKIRRCTSWVC